MAQDLRGEARLELLSRLHGDSIYRDILAFITAAGGGLTLRELSELTEQPVYELDSRIGAIFGRSRAPNLQSQPEPRATVHFRARDAARDR